MVQREVEEEATIAARPLGEKLDPAGSDLGKGEPLAGSDHGDTASAQASEVKQKKKVSKDREEVSRGG